MTDKKKSSTRPPFNRRQEKRLKEIVDRRVGELSKILDNKVAREVAEHYSANATIYKPKEQFSPLQGFIDDVLADTPVPEKHSHVTVTIEDGQAFVVASGNLSPSELRWALTTWLRGL